MLGVTSLAAQEPQGEGQVPQYPTTGVRFVICSPSGRGAKAQIPSSLFAKIGKDFLPVRISSRMPGERVSIDSDGMIRLYDEIPEDKEQKKEAKPLITIPVPPEYTKGKVTAIVVPSEDFQKSQFFFLREADFPTGGFHIINFSPNVLEFIHSPTDDLPEKGDTIGPYKRKENNGITSSDANVWSFNGKKNKDVKSMSYSLCTPPEGEGAMRVPIRQSKFSVDPSISQILVVVKHPTVANTFRLLSINFGYEADKRHRTSTPASAPSTPRR